MLSGKKRGFAAVEALCAALIAALLLAASAGMLISSGQLFARSEERLALERAKREARLELAARSSGAPGLSDAGGFRVTLSRRSDAFEEWKLSKEGVIEDVAGTLFVAPR